MFNSYVFLEKITDIPMPFRILQVIPDAIFTHTRTTVNKLYEENNQKKDPAQKKSDFSVRKVVIEGMACQLSSS